MVSFSYDPGERAMPPPPSLLYPVSSPSTHPPISFAGILTKLAVYQHHCPSGPQIFSESREKSGHVWQANTRPHILPPSLETLDPVSSPLLLKRINEANPCIVQAQCSTRPPAWTPGSVPTTATIWQRKLNSRTTAALHPPPPTGLEPELSSKP